MAADAGEPLLPFSIASGRARLHCSLAVHFMNCPSCGKSLWVSRDYCPFCETNIPGFLQSRLLEATQDPGVTKNIQTFVNTVLASPDLDDGELANRLMSAGLSRDDSERLNAFVTTAFGRYLLENKGAHFPPGFVIMDHDTGHSRSGLFSEELLYVAGREYAKRLGAENSTVAAIAERSPEAQILAGRSDPGSMQFTEPVFLRIPLEAPPKKGGRPWWKLWG